MRRASVGVLAFAFAWPTLASVGAARAQAAVDAASPINPAETACVSQSIGSACDSSSTSAGGTCQAGCCCHYVTDPEGAQYCEACLACSDTSNVDPAFSPGACSDGGTLASEDSGVFLFDAGMPQSTPTPPPTTDTPSSSCACSDAGARGGASSIQTALALLLMGALLAAARARARAPR